MWLVTFPRKSNEFIFSNYEHDPFHPVEQDGENVAF